MFFKQQKIGGFLLGTMSVCAALLLIVFSSYRDATSSVLSQEKKEGFSSLARSADFVPMSSTPVTVPSPAVFSKKGHSARASFTSKYIHLLPQVVFVGRFVSNQVGKIVQNVQPLRLHLALRVLRI
jgi:hypothetical protein